MTERLENKSQESDQPEKAKGLRRLLSFLFGKRKAEPSAQNTPDVEPKKNNGVSKQPSLAEKVESKVEEAKSKPIVVAFPKKQTIPSVEKKPAPKPQPEPKIRNLDQMSEADLLKAMTGEEAANPQEAKRLMDVKSSEKVEEEPVSVTKSDRLKAYPKAPEDEIDLHMKTREQADREIRSFVMMSKRKRLRKIRIITGKGLHSENGLSVIKEKTEEKIQELMRERVVYAFEWERSTKASSGAMIVYLA